MDALSLANMTQAELENWEKQLQGESSLQDDRSLHVHIPGSSYIEKTFYEPSPRASQKDTNPKSSSYPKSSPEQGKQGFSQKFSKSPPVSAAQSPSPGEVKQFFSQKFSDKQPSKTPPAPATHLSPQMQYTGNRFGQQLVNGKSLGSPIKAKKT